MSDNAACGGRGIKRTAEVDEEDIARLLEDDEDLMVSIYDSGLLKPPPQSQPQSKPNIRKTIINETKRPRQSCTSSSIDRVQHNSLPKNVSNQIDLQCDNSNFQFDDDDDDQLQLVCEIIKQKSPRNERSRGSDQEISYEDSVAIGLALTDLDNSLFASDLEEFYESVTHSTAQQLEADNGDAAQIRKLSIVDPRLELLDPNPDVHQLFRDFDHRFFGGYLCTTAVRIGWSNRFYNWAGAFYSITRDGCPAILLSEKLLSLRSRRDLVETLLHEMIHADIHLKRKRDKGDHGPLFCAEMDRINRAAGTRITIYHEFHAEVQSLRRFVWRCSGERCRGARPSYGYVRLATGRRPNRADLPFRLHQSLQCSGRFEQVLSNPQINAGHRLGSG